MTFFTYFRARQHPPQGFNDNFTAFVHSGLIRYRAIDCLQAALSRSFAPIAARSGAELSSTSDRYVVSGVYVATLHIKGTQDVSNRRPLTQAWTVAQMTMTVTRTTRKYVRSVPCVQQPGIASSFSLCFTACRAFAGFAVDRSAT